MPSLGFHFAPLDDRFDHHREVALLAISIATSFRPGLRRRRADVHRLLPCRAPHPWPAPWSAGVTLKGTNCGDVLRLTATYGHSRTPADTPENLRSFFRIRSPSGPGASLAVPALGPGPQRFAIHPWRPPSSGLVAHRRGRQQCAWNPAPTPTRASRTEPPGSLEWPCRLSP